ncbi:hypothetical protein P7K49_004269, partial [Saguinus oedipus]
WVRASHPGAFPGGPGRGRGRTRCCFGARVLDREVGAGRRGAAGEGGGQETLR